MTDMGEAKHDWAEKIAWKFASEFDDCGNSSEQIDVAEKLTAALRKVAIKAKADGMREAATFIENGRFLHDDSPPKRFANEVVPEIRRLADKLETSTE